jgi:hypothetical protein
MKGGTAVRVDVDYLTIDVAAQGTDLLGNGLACRYAGREDREMVEDAQSHNYFPPT